MPAPCPESAQAFANRGLIALDLTVSNHPGVMSHVCGLFTRRAYNMEAILVVPTDDPSVSRMWIVVEDNEKLDQMVSQAGKLHDVLAIRAARTGREECLDPLRDCLAALETQAAL